MKFFSEGELAIDEADKKTNVMHFVDLSEAFVTVEQNCNRQVSKHPCSRQGHMSRPSPQNGGALP